MSDLRLSSVENPPGFPESGWRPRIETGCRRVLEVAAAPVFDRSPAAILFVLILLGVAACRAVLLIPQYHYTHDTFIFIDAAWRILNGQTPSVDFYSPLGPAVFWVVALPLRWGADAGRAMAVTQALFGAAIGLSAFWLALRRLPHLFAAAASFFLLLLVVSPHNLGEAPGVLTVAMMYNRVGFAILGLLLLEATQPPLPGPRAGRREFLGGVCSGTFCSLLFLVKITFCMAAVPMLAALFPYRKQSPGRLKGLLAGAAAGAAVVAILVRGRFDAVLRDIRIAGHAKELELGRAASGTMAVSETMLLVVLLACIVAWLLSETGEPAPLARPWAALVMVPLSVALITTNYMYGAVPLVVFLGLLFAAEVVRISGAASRLLPNTRPLLAALAATLLLPAAHFAALEAGAVAYAAALRSRPYPAFAAAPIADVRTQETFYVDYVNDGLRLLEANSSPRESVFALEYVNPFSFALHRKPARGGAANLHYQSLYNDTSKPDPAWILGDADVVMLPKAIPGGGGELNIKGLRRNYVPALEARYTLAAESSDWMLYRRRPAAVLP